jgi:choline kinase
VKAVIPAAGFASRLRPLTDHCHKAMLPIGGTTMMAMTLRNLQLNGIREVILVTGYRADALQEYVHSIRDSLQVEFVHNPDYLTTNNAYSLGLAAPYAKGEAFLLLDCDIVFEPDVIKRLIESKHETAIAIQKRTDLGEEEMKVFSRDGKILDRIAKTGNPQEAVGESIGIEAFSAGFSAKLFEVLKRRIANGPGKTEFYEAAFQELVDRGETMHLVDVGDCRVMEVDFKTDLDRAEREILPYLHEITGR